MPTEAKLSSKGQIVIPKPVRDELGLKPGDRVKLEVVKGRKAMLQAASAPPADIFVKAGRRRVDAALRESRRRDEAKIRALLRALGVDD